MIRPRILSPPIRAALRYGVWQNRTILKDRLFSLRRRPRGISPAKTWQLTAVGLPFSWVLTPWQTAIHDSWETATTGGRTRGPRRLLLSSLKLRKPRGELRPCAQPFVLTRRRDPRRPMSKPYFPAI